MLKPAAYSRAILWATGCISGSRVSNVTSRHRGGMLASRMSSRYRSSSAFSWACFSSSLSRSSRFFPHFGQIVAANRPRLSASNSSPQSRHVLCIFWLRLSRAPDICDRLGSLLPRSLFTFASFLANIFVNPRHAYKFPATLRHLALPAI